MDIENAIQGLNDENVAVRKEAIEQLVNCKDKTIINPLIKAVTDENAQVRFKAAEILGNFGDDALDKLITQFESASGKNKRFFGFALKETGNPKVIEHFAEAVEDEDFGVRKVAIRGLGELHAEEKLNSIAKGLEDDDWGVRLATVYALGDIATPASINLIKQARRKESEKDFKKSCNKAIKKAEKSLKAKESGKTVSNTIPMSRIKEMEKTNLQKAIKEYEKYVTDEHPKDAPYKRLCVLYRKNNDYDNEIRVIKKAIEVLSSQNPGKEAFFQKRLDKMS